MKIRIFVFIDPSLKSQQVNSEAQDWWMDTDHPNLEEIYVIEAGPGNQDFINRMKVVSFPAVVFAQVIEPNAVKTISRLTGDVDRQDIDSMFKNILSGKLPVVENGGGGINPLPGSPQGSPTGAGMGLFNISLPPVVYLLGAAATGYKAVTCERPCAPLVMGGASVILLLLYLKNKKT